MQALHESASGTPRVIKRTIDHWRSAPRRKMQGLARWRAVQLYLILTLARMMTTTTNRRTSEFSQVLLLLKDMLTRCRWPKALPTTFQTLSSGASLLSSYTIIRMVFTSQLSITFCYISLFYSSVHRMFNRSWFTLSLLVLPVTLLFCQYLYFILFCRFLTVGACWIVCSAGANNLTN